MSADAEVGADALRADVARDDGASRLGELALVDREGRIGPLEHRLLRHAARRERRQPPRARQCVQLPGRGRGRPRAGERSAIHVDFMVGSNEVDVDGITRDGDRVPVLRGGTWQI